MQALLSLLKEELSSLVDINGHTYRRSFEGTRYHESTSGVVVNVLESARRCRNRYLVVYGNAETGEIWDAERCYIGRSTGPAKIPLCIYRSNSVGGAALLDHRVVGIRPSAGWHRACWNYLHHKVDQEKLEESIKNRTLLIRG